MMRTCILIAAAVMFGAIGAWTIWLAASIAAPWAVMSFLTLGASAVFFAIAADQA